MFTSKRVEKNLPSLLICWDERLTFRGTTRIRAPEGTHLNSNNGGENRPVLTGRSRANQAVRFQGGFQPVTAPLCETDTRHFPVLRI